MTAGTLVLALVSMLLLLQVTTAQPAAAASISVSPSAGPAGSSATVQGSAFLLDDTVSLCWDDTACSSLGTASPDLFGDFSVGISIPGDAATGGHTVTACGDVSGCGQASFQVLSAPGTSTTTTAPTTTSTTATTTTTLPTTTTTVRATTTTPPGPTTTRPGPITTTTRPATTSPPPTVTTTTTTVDPDQSGAPNSSTSTTEGIVIAPDTVTSLPEALGAPYALDVEALVAQLFAPAPETPVDPDATIGSTVGGLTGPLGEVSPTTVVEDEGGDNGIDFSLGETPTDGFQPKFGIWLVWLLGIVGSAGLALVVDEKRRRSRE